MAFKLITAMEAKPGATILLEGEACVVKSNDVSKTGKHGHAKCRIEAIGITDDKKRVLVLPGHERFDVPRIEKKRGQVLSAIEASASIMDLETFETFDVPIFEDLRGQINPEDQVEYWIIDEGAKLIKRKI